ncbi:ubiquinone biosynthesis protein [Sinosporangium album]|uniref:Ubiquinone biosynthesis protein n=1 Tax=Sinosporangium album TaxID=504805 RepID=A0A1G7U088_9ACTN|nr:AarF/ABC1/UbiB kinase family protein [Sinosporangium album]SDG40953.1 ubiquinone biosynthesis protein [Sinosporangium album]
MAYVHVRGRVVGVWVFVLGVTALVALEVLVPTGTLPRPATWVTGWKARRRRSKRYSRIVAIAVKHGLGGYIRGRRRLNTHENASKTARSLRDALNEGGVTFVKLGQMLSTRPDLIPAAFIEQLSTLQTKADPEPWERIQPAIERSLGRPLGQVFATIDKQPCTPSSTGPCCSSASSSACAPWPWPSEIRPTRAATCTGSSGAAPGSQAGQEMVGEVIG